MLIGYLRTQAQRIRPRRFFIAKACYSCSESRPGYSPQATPCGMHLPKNDIANIPIFTPPPDVKITKYMQINTNANRKIRRSLTVTGLYL